MSTVPTKWNNYVTKLRNFLRDTAALNRLEGVQESTDYQLYEVILDAMAEINLEYAPRTNWTSTDINVDGTGSGVLPWNTVKMGATLHLLTSVGILSARNTLTYNDTGGVTVQDYDKYGRYINYFNVLINKYVRSIVNVKQMWNAEQAWGGVSSDWYGLGSGGRDSEW